MGKHRKPEKANNATPATIGNTPAGKTTVNGLHNNLNAAKSGTKTASKSNLLLEPRPDWYTVDLPSIEVPDKLVQPSPKLLSTVQEYAVSLLASENGTYGETQLKSSSAHKFMATVMQSGTWSDKVSALTLVVQESPLHTRKPFETLLGMAAKRSRDNALMALSAIKDMLAQGLMLPGDRKLKYFNRQPGLLAGLQGVKPSWSQTDPLPEGISKAHLIFWAYEDWLKHKYFEVLQALETWCGDAIENARMRSLTYVFELLKDKPEQEENLLRLLVNKLGDPEKKIASRASHLLLQLQNFHPQMQSIVMTSIDSETLLKPGQSSSAKYYAAITLNQTILRKGDNATANTLMNIYFSIFVTILSKSKRLHEASTGRQEPDSSKSGQKRKRSELDPVTSEDTAGKEFDEKIVAQVLAGIHRAFPYCSADTATFATHIDTMFRITHSSNFNTSIQALLLIQQITQSMQTSTDRFMRTLYESLLDPRLLTSSKQTMYLNLLYRSLKSDPSLRRVKAMIKRLLQTLTMHDPPFVCAALYLIHEMELVYPAIASMLSQPEVHDEEEDEVFHDVPEEPVDLPSTNDSASQSLVHMYDGRKRDPDHSNADRTCLWELAPWTQHYHPSTVLFARTLINPPPATKSSKGKRQASVAFPPRPDPTTHTLVHFLDRFAYRKPKDINAQGNDISSNARGTSIMQPALASSNATDTLFTRSRHGDLGVLPSKSTSKSTMKSGKANTGLPVVNSEAFWSRKLDDVPANEVFFHRYFNDVGPRRKASMEKRTGVKDEKKSKSRTSDWDEDVGAGEDEIWKALVGSRPGMEDGDGPTSDSDDGDDDESDDNAFEEEMDSASAGSENDGGVELNLESDIESDEEVGSGAEDHTAFSDAGSFNLDDEGDDLLGSDEEMADSGQDLEQDQDQDKGSKHKEKRRKLADLPTFASAEDYARLIDEGEDSSMDGS